MSDLPDPMSPDELPPDAALALDVALGVLDGAERRDAELRLLRDPEFARAVDAWRAALAPLAAAIAPVAPPAAVWDRIAAAVEPRPAAAVPAAPLSLWASLNLWRGLAVGATGVAAAALGLLVTRPPQTVLVPAAPAAAARGELLGAAMTGTDKKAEVLLTATFDADRGAVILTPAAEARAAGLQPELWVIVGESPPKSLGLIDLDNPSAHVIPKAMLPELRNGATLAISLEPPGGSKTGAPTGPVVATGKLVAI